MSPVADESSGIGLRRLRVHVLGGARRCPSIAVGKQGSRGCGCVPSSLVRRAGGRPGASRAPICRTPVFLSIPTPAWRLVSERDALEAVRTDYAEVTVRYWLAPP